MSATAPKARLRYIAITAREPAVLANYYCLHFGMWLLGKPSAEGDIALTDGFYNLTLRKQRPGLGEEDAALGTNHFGIEIDDISTIRDRLGADAEIGDEAGDLFSGEFRVYDPNGLAVSLSTNHFHVPYEVHQGPSIRHIALSVPNNQQVLEFYTDVFGFRPTSANDMYTQRVPPTTTRMAGDGSTALAILPEPDLLDEPVDGHRKFGFNHFGFLVPDMDKMRARLPVGTVRKRPSNRPFAEYRVTDPEGNNFDIASRQGFEVDHGVWARVTPS